jgi:hypothetical protein
VHHARVRPVGRRHGRTHQRQERVDELLVLHEVGRQHVGVYPAAPDLVDEPVPDGGVPRGCGQLAELG